MTRNVSGNYFSTQRRYSVVESVEKARLAFSTDSTLLSDMIVHSQEVIPYKKTEPT